MATLVKVFEYDSLKKGKVETKLKRAITILLKTEARKITSHSHAIRPVSYKHNKGGKIILESYFDVYTVFYKKKVPW